MILTATPSPSIDWTVSVQDFAFGAVNRASVSEREPSGKGINVSIALQRHGALTHALIAGSGEGTEFITDALTAEGVSHTLTPAGPIRTNVTLLTDNHPDTKINTESKALTEDMLRVLKGHVTTQCSPDTTFLTAGSLPAGTDPNAHAQLITAARAQGAFAAVDTSGTALSHAVRAHPDLIKPNVSELQELTGSAPRTLGDVVTAAESLRSHGIGTVLVSMGADGALLVDAHGVLWGRAAPRQVRNSVGAGDALLAGFLSARPDRREALATAVRWGASAVEYATTLFTVASGAAIPAVLDDDPDLSTPITSGES